MNKTKIEYLDMTWNPLTMRCTPVSEGCANCWHLTIANRLAANPNLSDEVRAVYAGKSQPVLVSSRLDNPLRRKKPAVIGVQFMGDLFHEDVPFQSIDHVFHIMEVARKHTYQVLTKRPERLREYMYVRSADFPPTRNIWLGVTAENQKAADKRIPLLLQIPAAVRFVSVEPMLEPVSIQRYLHCQECGGSGYTESGEFCGCNAKSGLSWVICGGESGPNRRPFDLDWARDLRDQCKEAGVAFFMKQVDKVRAIPPDLVIREYPR